MHGGIAVVNYMYGVKRLDVGHNVVYIAMVMVIGVAIVAAFWFYYRSMNKYSAYMPLKDEPVY